MQITILTIHGIQALREYRKAGGILTNEEIARRLNIDREYAFKVNRQLKRAGFLSAMRGSQGGYAMARGATDRSVADLIAGVEGLLMIQGRDTGAMQVIRSRLQELLVCGGLGKSVKTLL